MRGGMFGSHRLFLVESLSELADLRNKIAIWFLSSTSQKTTMLKIQTNVMFGVDIGQLTLMSLEIAQALWLPILQVKKPEPESLVSPSSQCLGDDNFTAAF